jgi:hypothetical protein
MTLTKDNNEILDNFPIDNNVKLSITNYILFLMCKERILNMAKKSNQDHGNVIEMHLKSEPFQSQIIFVVI